MQNKVYVGNLPYSITEQELQDAFQRFGSVESVHLVTDRETGRSRGFAFVELNNEAEAEQAVNGMNDTELGGRTIVVNLARPKAPRAPGGGGFRRGSREGGRPRRDGFRSEGRAHRGDRGGRW